MVECGVNFLHEECNDDPELLISDVLGLMKDTCNDNPVSSASSKTWWNTD